MAESPSDASSLTGKTIGPYQIEEEIGQSRWGKLYRAFQSAVDRRVALKILSPEIAELPGKVDHFLEESRGEAQIGHAHIAAVYEAGRADGMFYCAMEMMDGPDLAGFLRQEDGVDEHHLLQVIVSIAGALDFLWQKQIPHEAPASKNILTNQNGTVKLINVGSATASPSQSPPEDIQTLGVALATVVNEIGPVSKPVGEFVERMWGAEGQKRFESPSELAKQAKDLDRRLFPPPPPPEPAIQRIEAKKTSPVVIAVAGAVIVLVVLTVGYLTWKREKPTPGILVPDDLGVMVQVPAGKFIYQNGEEGDLPAFYIDKYEVTFREYQEFLNAVATGTEIETHPFTPRNKDFKPANWKLILDAINNRKLFNNRYLSWNSPVFNVDWFDAYAYAAWRGKSLPTEEQWEKAARGTEGRLYPWGDTFEPGKCDCGPDDGTQKALLVYAHPQDETPFGVVGMAGGESEWTASQPARGRAVIRGGSWAGSDAKLTQRQIDRRREFRAVTVGFRCVADHEIQP